MLCFTPLVLHSATLFWKFIRKSLGAFGSLWQCSEATDRSESLSGNIKKLSDFLRNSGDMYAKIHMHLTSKSGRYKIQFLGTLNYSNLSRTWNTTWAQTLYRSFDCWPTCIQYSSWKESQCLIGLFYSWTQLISQVWFWNWLAFIPFCYRNIVW